jgi:hypothetical protein
LVNNNNNSVNHEADSIRDSTEIIIRRTIAGIQKLLNPRYGNTPTPEKEEAAAAVITINPATKKHFELQIKTLQDAPRDTDKLKENLQAKEKEYEEAEDSEDIERLVTEIDMLSYLLFLVNRRNVAAEEEMRQ